ncbi:MAG: nucleotidyltransferase [Caldilineaceae bacterium]
MERQLESSLQTVVTYLEQEGYRYAIIGGIALSYWGVLRATYDVDLKVLVPDNDYPAIRAALLTTFPTLARPELPANSLIVAVKVGDVIVDFLLALPGYEEMIIERAVQARLGDWSAWVCTAEDLIIQKAVAGREKDWLDIEALLIEQARQLDTEYVYEWLVQFAEALENPQLLQKYLAIAAKVKNIR